MAIIKDPNGNPLNCEVREVSPHDVLLGSHDIDANTPPQRHIKVIQSAGQLVAATAESAAAIKSWQEMCDDGNDTRIYVDVINVERKEK